MSVTLERVTGFVFVIAFQLFIYYVVFERGVSAGFVEHANTRDYVSYVMIGNALNILSFSTLLSVGRSLTKEIREGTIESLLLSPAHRAGFFVGTYLEQSGRSFLEFLAVLLIGLLFGAKYSLSLLPQIVFITLVSSVAFFSVSVVLSTAMVFTRDTYIIQNALLTLMCLLCGVEFPVQFLPAGIRWMSEIFPLTPAVKLFRDCVMGGQSISDNIPLLVQMFVLSAAYFAVGMLWLRGMETRLVEEVFS